MDELIRRGIRGDFGYRTRAVEALCEQVRRNHAEFNRLWEKMKTAPLKRGEEEQLVRAMSWSKMGIEEYKRMKGLSIEGVTCVEIDEIERDLRDKDVGCIGLNLRSNKRTRILF